MIKRTLTLWLLLAYFVLSICSLHAQFNSDNDVREQIAKLPQKERERLRYFFDIFLRSDAVYTLFGDKPISIAFFGSDGTRSVFLKDGKRIWEEYEVFFATKKFFLKFQSNQESRQVCLLNKSAVLRTIEQYLPTFQAILGPDASPEKILQELLKKETNIQQVLENNECLFGLLLGYGYRNSFLFQKRNELCDAMKNWLIPPFSFKEQILSDDDLVGLRKTQYGFFTSYTADQKNNKLSPEFIALVDEYKHIENLLQPCPQLEDEPLEMFALPRFAAVLDDPETQALLEKYTKTRQEIVTAYSQRDLLEVTLCKMTER